LQLTDGAEEDIFWLEVSVTDILQKMNILDDGSQFRELERFFELKYLNSLMRMRIRDPRWKKFGSGINIPVQQHCIKGN
jgi:hypothetical protein